MTVRSTRRRLVQGTGATLALQYALVVPQQSNLGVGTIYYDSNWNLTGYEFNPRSAAAIDCNNSFDTVYVDPLLAQWYYIPSGASGSSQRTTAFGFLSNSANNGYRWIARRSTAITELGATGTTESYSGSYAAVHPSGQVIANTTTANTRIRFWSKVAKDNWTYVGTDLTGLTNLVKLAYSPAGGYLAAGRQTAAVGYVWRVDNALTGAHTLCSLSVSDTNNAAAVAFENETTLLIAQSFSTGRINYYTRSAPTVWGASGGSVGADNPGLNGGVMRDTPNRMVISPDGTVMVCGYNATPTAGGNAHWYFFKIAGKWVYQGPLPSATATTPVNDIKITSDGLFCIVAFAGTGYRVYSLGSGALSHLKQLTFTTGCQNGIDLLTSSNHKYFGVAVVAPWSDPAGRTAIDNQIELVSPSYWWKCNEYFDQTVANGDEWIFMRNFGSSRTGLTVGTGNISPTLTSAGVNTHVTSRVPGPLSGSFGFGVDTSFASSITTSSTGRVDGDTSGTIAFFVKYTGAVASHRQIWSDDSPSGSGGVHVNIYNGKLALRFGTTGASARAYIANSSHNDGNWHFVVWRQPADGTGPTLSVDGVTIATTANADGGNSTGSSAALIDYWMNSSNTSSTQFGGDSTAVAWNVMHFFLMSNTLMSNAQELAIKAAAGL